MCLSIVIESQNTGMVYPHRILGVQNVNSFVLLVAVDFKSFINMNGENMITSTSLEVAEKIKGTKCL